MESHAPVSCNIPAFAGVRKSLAKREKILSDEEILGKQGYNLLPGQLGEGSYAKVKKAKKLDINKNVALKIIDKSDAPEKFLSKFLPRELTCLQKIKHENIIHMYDILYINNKVVIVLELASRGDLLEYIKLRQNIVEEVAGKFFMQLTDAIKYIHGQGICHRDLKCENVLLHTERVEDNKVEGNINNGGNNKKKGNNNNEVINNGGSYKVKLTDFGFGREFGKKELSETFCGSAAYAAPEVLSGTKYSPVYYDVWSCGIILYIMVNGSMPYDDTKLQHMVKMQRDHQLRFSSKVQLSTEVKNLIKQILHPVPEKRPSLQEIQDDVWLKGIREKLQEEKNTLHKNEANN